MAHPKKCIKILKSDNPKKHYLAIFHLHGLEKNIVYFGNSRFQTFTTHKDKKKRNSYIRRHSKKEKWIDPEDPKTLERYLLWETECISDNIKLYKKMFNLN